MRVFSDINPTDKLHIGNYLGAIKQWLSLQENNKCILCIIDLYSITTPYNSRKLQKNILEITINYLAIGVDLEKSIVFIQSQVKEHTELAWLLGTITPLEKLKKTDQFKKESKSHSKNINASILNYPILSAADILLYQTDIIPIKKNEQRQYAQIARDTARRFNQIFGETFKEPKPLSLKTGQKIMSLQEPKKKMSKSDSAESRIGLFDKPEEIKRKIMTAATDSKKKIKYDPKRKPGISNLLTIYSLFSNHPVNRIEKKFRETSYTEFKKQLVELLISELEPFRRKRKELLSREIYIKEALKRGVNRAKTIAQSTMADVRRKMGIDFYSSKG